MQTVVLYFLHISFFRLFLSGQSERDNCSIYCCMIVDRNTNYLSIPLSLYNHLQLKKDY